MTSQMVLTVIGHDRPGLVDRLSGMVAQHGGNWLESRMGHLGGEFAGILRVQLPEEKTEAFLEGMKQLEGEGLTVVVRTEAQTPVVKEGTETVIEVTGQDRPGIVSQLSNTLARYQVNVEELQTECVSAPMSGETLFKAVIRMKIPAGCDVGSLRNDLEKSAADLMVDIEYPDPLVTEE